MLLCDVLLKFVWIRLDHAAVGVDVVYAHTVSRLLRRLPGQGRSDGDGARALLTDCSVAGLHIHIH